MQEVIQARLLVIEELCIGGKSLHIGALVYSKHWVRPPSEAARAFSSKWT